MISKLNLKNNIKIFKTILKFFKIWNKVIIKWI